MCERNICYWKVGVSGIQVYRTICFLLDIYMSSPLQRFWPSAEKWLSVTVLVAKFVHLENRVERVYTGQFFPRSSQECASGI